MKVFQPKVFRNWSLKKGLASGKMNGSALFPKHAKEIGQAVFKTVAGDWDVNMPSALLFYEPLIRVAVKEIRPDLFRGKMLCFK